MNRPAPITALILMTTALMLALQGCGASSAPAQGGLASGPLDAELRAVIAAHGLTGDPSTGRDLPSIEEPLAQLGKQLFFSQVLSGDMDVACASCHHPLLGGGDNLAVSIGAGAVQPDVLGPGRVHHSGQPNVGRNALTTFNVGLWDQAMFWDGRVESLGKTPGQNGAGGQGIRTPDSYLGDADPQAGDDLVSAQSRFPVTSISEMRGHAFEQHKPNDYVRQHLLGRLGDYGPGQGELPGNGWLAEFQKAFCSRAKAEELINDANLAAVLGAYQRSQVFVDTPWRAYVQGDDTAIDATAKQGALLFFLTADQGGAGCVQCHAGDFFTDQQYHVLAVPQVGPGKDDGTYQDDDYGRFRETGRPQDLYAFRTPTLLNVAVTGPYGHDGAYATLEGIVRHHLNPARAVEAYDAGQLDPSVQTAGIAYNTARSLAKLDENRRLGLPTIQDIDLSDAQVEALVAFLHALTDPCVLAPNCLAPWLPGQGEEDPDGLRLDGQLPARTVVP